MLNKRIVTHNMKLKKLNRRKQPIAKINLCQNQMDGPPRVTLPAQAAVSDKFVKVTFFTPSQSLSLITENQNVIIVIDNKVCRNVLCIFCYKYEDLQSYNVQDISQYFLFLFPIFNYLVFICCFYFNVLSVQCIP